MASCLLEVEDFLAVGVRLMPYCDCRSGRHGPNPPYEVRSPCADEVNFRHICTLCYLPRIKRAVTGVVTGPRPDLAPEHPAYVPPDPRDLHGNRVSEFNRPW